MENVSASIYNRFQIHPTITAITAQEGWTPDKPLYELTGCFYAHEGETEEELNALDRRLSFLQGSMERTVWKYCEECSSGDWVITRLYYSGINHYENP